MRLESVKVLAEKCISYRLIELMVRAVSVDDVMKYAKGEINRDEICKTIIMKDPKGGNYAILLLGKDRIDFPKARKVIGHKVRIASAEEVKEATGIEPGAVCPLLLKVPLFVDVRVFEQGKINFGSGDHLYGMEISPKDLERVVKFEVVDIALR